MPDKKLFALIALISFALFAALCTGCGGKGGTASTLLGTSTGDNISVDTQPHDFGQAIAGLTHATTPEGVDHTLWKELTAALADALKKRQASDAPLINAARVNDLSFNLTVDPPTSFAWDYLNPGDYDLNGEANIADLSKIAEYFMVNETSPEWPSALVADGDGNGELNLADVTLIAQNFKGVVSGYILQASDAETDAPWSDVGQMDYADAVAPDGGGMPRFSLELAAPEYGKYYRVVPFEKTGSGEIVHTNTGAAGVPVLYTPDARGDWHTRGHDAQHTNLSTHAGPTTNHVYWTHEIGGNGKSSPVYNVDGTIYVGGSDGLFIFPPDHNPVSIYLTPDVVETTPAIAKDGTIYFGCNDGVFRAISPGGGLKWSFTAGDAIRSSPVVGEDGTVFFGCDDFNLYALTPDGNLKWIYESEEEIHISPRLSGEGFVFVDSGLHEYDLLDPTGQSVFELGSTVYSYIAPLIGFWDYDPAQWVDGETIPANPIETYIKAVDSHLYGYPLDQELPELAAPLTWTFPSDMESDYLIPSLTPDGGLLVAESDNDHYKFDKDRNLEWENIKNYNWDYAVTASIDSEGTAYHNDFYGNVTAIDPDGLELWTLADRGRIYYQITIAEGTLYFVNTQGWLHAIGGPGNGTLPEFPQGLKAGQGSSPVSITISWNQANGANKYEVYRDSLSNLVATVDPKDWDEMKYKDEDVEVGTSYEYWVRAVNVAGSTDFTESVLGWARLEQPENVDASEGVYTDKTVLTWDAVQNATSYGIYKDYAGGDPLYVVEGQTTWTDYAADWDTHRYWVKAYNSVAESSRSLEATGFVIRGVGDSGAGSWNQYKANSMRTNQASSIGPSEGTFAWATRKDSRFKLDGDTPAMFGSEGAIYVPEDDYIVCFNPNGSLRWSAISDANFPVVTADGSIVTMRYISNEKNLVILNSDGTDQLVSNGFAPRDFSISADGSLIATEDFAVVSFNLDATVNWRYDFEDHPDSSPPIISPNGTVYFLSYYWNPLAPPNPGPSRTPRDLNALNPDGTLRWVKPFEDSVYNLVVGPDEKIYLSDSDNAELVALNPDASVAWTKPYPDLSFKLSVDAAGSIYVVRSDDTVDVFLSDGTLKWSNNLDGFDSYGFYRSPVIDSNGDIFLLGMRTGSAVVIACDQDGEVKWNVQRDIHNLGALALDGFGRLIFCGRETVDDNQTNDLFCIGPPL